MRTIKMVLLLTLITTVVSGQWSIDPNVNNAICTASYDQFSSKIVSDGAGGAIVSWQDYRSGAYDVYAQRIDVSGNVLWTIDGVPISAETDAQMSPDITSDGQGGAIITWRDYRDNGNQDIYAQRIDNNGVVQWTVNGLAVSVSTADQYTPAITSDGNGGAIITWWDYRNGTNSDIYAQQISYDGQLGVVTDVDEKNLLPSSFNLEQNYPNPFNPSTTISWQSPISGWQTIKLFDVLGREIETIVDGYYEAGSHSTLYIANLPVRQAGSALPSGVYFYQLKTGDPSTSSGQSFILTKKMLMLK